MLPTHYTLGFYEWAYFFWISGTLFGGPWGHHPHVADNDGPLHKISCQSVSLLARNTQPDKTNKQCTICLPTVSYSRK